MLTFIFDCHYKNVFKNKYIAILTYATLPEISFDFYKNNIFVSNLNLFSSCCVSMFQGAGSMADTELCSTNQLLLFLPIANRTAQEFPDSQSLKLTDRHVVCFCLRCYERRWRGGAGGVGVEAGKGGFVRGNSQVTSSSSALIGSIEPDHALLNQESPNKAKVNVVTSSHSWLWE